MSTLSALFRPVLGVLKLLLIGAVALGALLFGTLVAVGIFLGVSLLRLFRGRGEGGVSKHGERVFEGEYEVVRRPGSGVLTPLRRDRD